MARKMYEIELKDGTALRLRLTARALNAWLENHNLQGMAPVVGVLSAVDNFGAMSALFNAALKCDERNAIQSGDELIDTLIDDGKGMDYCRRLVVLLAAGCGLLAPSAVEQVLTDLDTSQAVKLQAIHSVLTGEPLPETAGGEEEENPTP